VIDEQVAAYNDHDLDRFLACYAEDVVVRDGHGATLMAGLEALRAQYGQWFSQHPDLHVEVRGRLQAGSWIVDEEHVQLGGSEMDGVACYHVADGRIDVVVLLVDHPPA
jgi:hypothetical protein